MNIQIRETPDKKVAMDLGGKFFKMSLKDACELWGRLGQVLMLAGCFIKLQKKGK